MTKNKKIQPYSTIQNSYKKNDDKNICSSPSPSELQSIQESKENDTEIKLKELDQ